MYLFFFFFFWGGSTVLFLLDFSYGKFRLLSTGKASQLRQSHATQPKVHAYWVFSCFHNPPNSDTDYRIFNMRTDVNADNYTRVCTDTVRESALWEKNPSPHRGIEPTSAACRFDALPTELHPCHQHRTTPSRAYGEHKVT